MNIINQKKIVVFLFLLCSSFCFCQNKTQNNKGEVIYHVFLRSFYDSNGDSQGDLNGLKLKLPYLQDLGITSILLLPLYDADCYHNYFANDFEKIDAEFGTMKDYISLVKEIHKRGLKVYVDMETQYVTEKHLWWKDAVGNPKSKYSDFILFEDSAHNIPATIVADLRALDSYDGSKIKLTTVNLRSKNVLEYNKKLFGFFVDPNNDRKFDDGVDGFRLDHAMDNLDGKAALKNLFQDFWTPLLSYVKQINPKLKNVAEQADWGDYGFNYFKNAGVDRMFAFGIQNAIQSFNKQKLIKSADTILAKCPTGKEQLVFIENHDMFRFATVEANVEKQKIAAALMMLIGGIPSIYYGQEIGMKGTFGVMGNTDGNGIPCREAFEWYKNTKGKGLATWYKNTGEWWNKTNLKPNDGISVEEQRNDNASLYNFYKMLIQLKQSNPALAIGKYEPSVNNNDKVFSFYRTFENRKVLVAANLSEKTQNVVFKKVHNQYISVYGRIKMLNKDIVLKPFEIAVFEVK